MRVRHYIFGIVFIVLLVILYDVYEENTYIRQLARQSRTILQKKLADYNSNEPTIVFENIPPPVGAKIVPTTVPIQPEDFQEVENVPNILLADPNRKPKSFNKTCAYFPSVFDLKFTNDHWQTQQTSNGTLQLLNAYLDDRLLNKNRSTVRILGMWDILKPEMTFYCQIWFDPAKPPTIVKVMEFYHIWEKGWGGGQNGIYQPYLISCDLPSHVVKKIPFAVSLVENPCAKATNSLRVIYNKPKTKKNFVVCVKGLNFPREDKSFRLAEWIELINILGAEKINFYEFSVHPNVKKLLDYYVTKGMVEVTPLTLVGHSSNVPFLQNLYLRKKVNERRLQEVVPYNDCLYRHMYEYRYVVLLDIDEVIMPRSGTWVELLEELEKINKGKKAAFHARNVYFLDELEHEHREFQDIPQYMHMLQHVYRARSYTKPGYYVKCFQDTDQVVATHNHFPRTCLNSTNCPTKEIDTNLAQLQHYRSDCVKQVSNCADLRADSVMDTRIWNFKEELIKRVVGTLTELGFLRQQQT